MQQFAFPMKKQYFFFQNSPKINYTFYTTILQIATFIYIKYKYQFYLNSLLKRLLMCKQYSSRKPKDTKLKAQIKPQEHLISKVSKAFVTGKEIRKKIFEKLRKGRGSGSQKKNIKLSVFLDANGKNHLNGYFSQSHVTCPICYDVMVAPVLLQCGHTFCLNCLEPAYFSCQQCSLCRKQIDDDSFSISTQMNQFVKFFRTKIMKNEERNSYEQREKTFNLNELKRALPLDLQMGSYVDYNLNNKWREAKVEQVQKLALVLNIYDKSSKQTFTTTVSLKSRRLAKHRTFTTAPPLKPTYFSKNFNFSAPVMQLIVEGPSYVVRRQIHLPEEHSNNVQEQARNSWDQFETIQNGNNWYFSENEDQLPRQSENMWNLSMDDDIQSIFLI